jgi:TRAP-type C4-dicarboxylate transport system permease small subunit
LIVRLTTAGIGLLMAVIGLQLAADAWSFSMAGVPLPQGVIFLPIAVGGALIAVFAIERMFIPRKEGE